MGDKFTLREYTYFDRQKVEDFLSTIEDGLSREFSEVKTEEGAILTPEIEVSASLPGIGGIKPKISGQTARKITTREELKTATDASLFRRLYDYLNEEDMIKEINPVSLTSEIWNEIDVGNVLEIKGHVERPALEKLIDNLNDLLSLAEALNSSSKPSSDNGAMKYFESIQLQLKMKGSNIKVNVGTDLRFKFVGTLFPNKLKVIKQEIEGDYTLLCRVQKILGEGETVQFFSIVPGNLKLDDKQIASSLDGFEKVAQSMNIDGNIREVEIEGPLIVITPIAIYR